MTPWTVRDSADEKANAAMASAVNAWAAEMERAIVAGVVAKDENPETQSEAVVTINGVDYVAALSFSLRPSN